MDFINELQKFLKQLGFRPMESQSKIIWIKDTDNGREERKGLLIKANPFHCHGIGFHITNKF